MHAKLRLVQLYSPAAQRSTVRCRALPCAAVLCRAAVCFFPNIEQEYQVYVLLCTLHFSFSLIVLISLGRHVSPPHK